MASETGPRILDCEMRDYHELSSAGRRELLDALASDLGDPWSPWVDDERIVEHRDVWPGKSYADRPLQMSFVPGGVFKPGLSTREEGIVERWLDTDETRQDRSALEMSIDALLEHQPDTDGVRISPFLMSCDPLQRREVEAIRQEVPDLRIPTDFEWEWAVRAGSRTMFWWGDDPPSRIDAPHQLPNGDHPLALREIAWSREHCEGEEAPGAPPRFTRGGIEECCPWQNTGEFTLLLSAYRRPGTSSWMQTRPVIPLT